MIVSTMNVGECLILVQAVILDTKHQTICRTNRYLMKCVNRIIDFSSINNTIINRIKCHLINRKLILNRLRGFQFQYIFILKNENNLEH